MGVPRWRNRNTVCCSRVSQFCTFQRVPQSFSGTSTDFNRLDFIFLNCVLSNFRLVTHTFHTHTFKFQVVLPSPTHTLAADDEVLFLRRMACHYNPAWLNGKSRHRLGDLPKAFADFIFPGVLTGISRVHEVPGV